MAAPTRQFRAGSPGTGGGDTPGADHVQSGLRVRASDLQALLVVVLAASAAIHLAVTPAHLREYTGFGVFFIVAAGVQAGVAVLCARGASRTSACAAALLSGVIALVWLVSRTTGLPIGPEVGQAEPVGLADAVSTLYEVAAVVVASLLACRLQPRRSVRMRMSPAVSTWAVFAAWIAVGAVLVGH